MGKSIYPMLNAKAGSRLGPHSRRSSVRMSLQPAIPWWVALPQSPPPLHRPESGCDRVILPVEKSAANGKHGLNCLCQPRGQPHTLLLHKDCDHSSEKCVPSVWRLRTIAANGQLSLVRINDARLKADIKKAKDWWSPMADRLRELNAAKVIIDSLGKLHEVQG